jgi:hypothetical protein
MPENLPNPESRQAEKNNRVAIITAFTGLIAAVITLGAAVVPLLQSRIDGLRHQISKQSIQISTLKAQTVPNAPEGGSYLSNVNPVTDDEYDARSGPVVINGVTYPNSVTFSCNGPLGNSAPLAYSVSGAEFTAVIGYGPGPGNGDQNETATVTITNQFGHNLGDRVEITPGYPLQVHLPLNGVSRLGFTCSDIDTQTGSIPVLPPRITLARAST